MLSIFTYAANSEHQSAAKPSVGKIVARLVLGLPVGLFLFTQSSADDQRLTTSELSNKGNLTITTGSGGLIPSQRKLSIADNGLSSASNSRFTDELSNRLTVEEEGSQGLHIDRLTSLDEGSVGTLGGGTDFSEYLSEFEHLDLDRDSQHIENRMHWLTPNGFSIALESTASPAVLSADRTETNDLIDNSTSVVLSWQPDQDGNPGDYRISAIGTRLNLNPGRAGLVGNTATGWGLDLQGNWQIGDLVAALSVTYGKGIDSYTLRRGGKDLYVTARREGDSSASYSFQPSLYYKLNDKSKFHMVLGRYRNENGEDNSYTADQTIDTLHLQYTWSPWPKTEFGLAISREDSDDVLYGEDSSRILLEGSRRF